MITPLQLTLSPLIMPIAVDRTAPVPLGQSDEILQSQSRMDHTLEHLYDVALAAQSPNGFRNQISSKKRSFHTSISNSHQRTCSYQTRQKGFIKMYCCPKHSLQIQQEEGGIDFTSTSMLMFLREPYIAC